MRDFSHIAGFGRWATEEAWASLGKRHRDIFNRFCGQFPNLTHSSRTKLLEWGPGGGAIAVAFSDLLAEYVGVDVSGQSIEAAERALQGSAMKKRFILLRSAPKKVDLPSSYFDLFISAAVFQHFPSRAYAQQVLSVANRTMVEGGLGFVQIRFDNGRRSFRQKPLHMYKRSFVTQTSFRMEDFWEVVRNAGFEPLMVTDIIPRVNYATFLFRKPVLRSRLPHGSEESLV